MSLDVFQFTTKIDVVQVATNLLVAGFTAWIFGLFGVRRGLARGQRQAAFDHRLAWYEKSLRVLNEFRRMTWNFTTIKSADDERKSEIIEGLDRSFANIEDCFNEAAAFAERRVLRELVSLESRLSSLHAMIKDLRSDDVDRELIQNLARLVPTTDKLMVTIAQGIRKQLNLDKIRPQDLAKKKENGEESKWSLE
jgi:hypothetical protein